MRITVQIEHKLEAVFSSFSQYGKWDPQQMVLPQHDVKGMSGLKFLSVCRRAGLVDDDCITPRLIRDLFSVHKDTVRNAPLLVAPCAARAPLLLDKLTA